MPSTRKPPGDKHKVQPPKPNKRLKSSGTFIPTKQVTVEKIGTINELYKQEQSNRENVIVKKQSKWAKIKDSLQKIMYDYINIFLYYPIHFRSIPFNYDAELS